MSKFIELYRPYNDYLIQELGLDWYELRKTSEENGNGPGIYPDSAACFVKFAKADEVNTVLELGSGASTIFLSTICKQLNKTFLSIEESFYWRSVTESLLSKYELDQRINLMEGFDFSSISRPDLLFIDSDPKGRRHILQDICNDSWQSDQIPIILLDDAEDIHYTIPVVETLSKFNRFNNWFFNPVHRQDRSLLVNHKDNSFNLSEWFWEWKPDKVYW